MSAEHVDIAELVRRIEQSRDSGPAALVFDGDGTLWSGDVAEDVFRYAVKRQLLRAEPREALQRTAREHGEDDSGSTSDLAGRLLEAYERGTFPERTVFEVMAWCFAGYRLDELSEIARDALDLAGLDARLHRSLAPLFELAAREGIRIVVVSASPRFVVEQAARRWHVAPTDIAASTPALDGDRVLPELAGPIPYAETKVDHARTLIGDARWLAAFGDSGFDFHMMRAAALGVAVKPKPSLLEHLGELRSAVVLDD
jgi:phosphatidylglycerophosphatase C